MENIMTHIMMLATDNDEQKVKELKVNRYQFNLEDFSCYKELVSSFSENCFKLSDVSFEKWNLLMCQASVIHVASVLICTDLMLIFILINTVICMEFIKDRSL
jgi:hypothetical protein